MMHQKTAGRLQQHPLIIGQNKRVIEHFGSGQSFRGSSVSDICIGAGCYMLAARSGLAAQLHENFPCSLSMAPWMRF